MLLTGLIIHEFNPRDLLIGTLLPLPKTLEEICVTPTITEQLAYFLA